MLFRSNKAIDESLMDSTITTATSTRSLSSSMVSSNKKARRSYPEKLSTNAHDQNHLLPSLLDYWSELAWDDSSELTLDESTFDNLVESVAANSDDLSNNPTGMMIEHDLMTEQSTTIDIAPVDYNRVSADDKGTIDIDHISLTISEMMSLKRASRDTERMSFASFTLNDEMVSWLVGESDFVLQV